MTPEQRFDRLERIIKLMVKAGLRSRRTARDQDDKINILIEMQRDNVLAFAEVREALGTLTEAQRRLTESQAHTDHRLDALIDIVREKRNDN